MKTILNAAIAGVFLACATAPAFADPIDAPRLKSMVEGMGYPTKDINDPGQALKFELSVKSGEFDVPIALEVSASGRYIWATAFLGDADVDGDLALDMLKTNAAIQPTAFWITETDKLMIGMAIDNRDVTPVHLKFVFEKLSGDVANTSDIWDW